MKGNTLRRYSDYLPGACEHGREPYRCQSCIETARVRLDHETAPARRENLALRAEAHKPNDPAQVQALEDARAWVAEHHPDARGLRRAVLITERIEAKQGATA